MNSTTPKTPRQIVDEYVDRTDDTAQDELVNAIESAIKEAVDANESEIVYMLKDFIPDPHKEHELCDDCAMVRSMVDAIRSRSSKKEG